MLSDYTARKEAKIEHYLELSQKTHDLSNQVCDQARKMADVIPFGQPILVGHYSEKRDRNYRDRIWSKFKKSAELEEKAKYYARKADAIENGKSAISSDDPDAIEALKEKLQNLKDSHKLMIEGNKIIRKKNLTPEQKIAELVKIGLNEEKATGKLKPDCMDHIGFPAYAITNSGANIKRIEERIKQLEKQKAEITKEYQIGNITISDSVEDNRIMITFPGIPEETIRDKLKRDGFRWSPKNQAWQAYRSAAWKIPELIRFFSVMPCYINPNEYLLVEKKSEQSYNLYLTGFWFNQSIKEETMEDILNLFYDGIHNYPAEWISSEFITMQKESL
jgi:hypothetical protein